MINDLQASTCDTYKYVDDSTMAEVNSDPAVNDLQVAANETSLWSEDNDCKVNASKTKEMLIDFSRSRSGFQDIHMSGVAIERVSEAKMLGVTISDNLKWNAHVSSITAKASKRLFMLYCLKRAGIPQSDIVAIYKSKIRSILEYACEAWHPGLTGYLEDDLEYIQERAMKIIYGYDLDYEDALKIANLSSLKVRHNNMCIKFVNNMKKTDHKLQHLLPEELCHPYNLRKP